MSFYMLDLVTDFDLRYSLFSWLISLSFRMPQRKSGRTHKQGLAVNMYVVLNSALSHHIGSFFPII